MVSLLVDQLSGLFLKTKKNGPITQIGQFFVSTLLIFFCPAKILESDQFSKKTGQKIQESGQKKLSGLSETG